MSGRPLALAQLTPRSLDKRLIHILQRRHPRLDVIIPNIVLISLFDLVELPARPRVQSDAAGLVLPVPAVRADVVIDEQGFEPFGGDPPVDVQVDGKVRSDVLSHPIRHVAGSGDLFESSVEEGDTGLALEEQPRLVLRVAQVERFPIIDRLGALVWFQDFLKATQVEQARRCTRFPRSRGVGGHPSGFSEPFGVERTHPAELLGDVVEVVSPVEFELDPVDVAFNVFAEFTFVGQAVAQAR